MRYNNSGVRKKVSACACACERKDETYTSPESWIPSAPPTSISIHAVRTPPPEGASPASAIAWQSGAAEPREVPIGSSYVDFHVVPTQYCISPLMIRTLPWIDEVQGVSGGTYCTALDCRVATDVLICATRPETVPSNVLVDVMAAPWFVTCVVNGARRPFTMDVSDAEAVLTAVAMAADRSDGTWLMAAVMVEMDVVAPPAVLNKTSPAMALTTMLLLTDWILGVFCAIAPTAMARRPSVRAWREFEKTRTRGGGE